jgi:lambda family phage minor tail protein L
MRQLPANLIIEKNKLTSDDPWLVLINVSFSGGTNLYYVRNLEDVYYSGTTYTAFPFEIDVISESSQGEIPKVSLRVSNVMRALQAYIEDLDGAVGSGVTVTVVSRGNLSENYAELEMQFDILQTSVDADWVEFVLGAPNPLRQRFPQYKYVADYCNWQYQGVECTYSGSLSSCSRTFEACRGHGAEAGTTQTARFGGYQGLKGRAGIRVV